MLGMINMELEVQSWGEDAAIRLPVEFLNQMKLKLGDKLTVEIHSVGATLRRKPRYSLAELVQQCDIASSPTADMIAWDYLKPVGREDTEKNNSNSNE